MAMIEKFFERIQAQPPAQIDEKYIIFIRQFSFKALEKRS